MKISERIVDTNSLILDFDFIDKDNFILITAEGSFYKNGNEIPTKIRKTDDNWYRIGYINPDKFLIINAGIRKEGQINSWIINEKGMIEKSIALGPAHRFLVIQDKVIVSYSDADLDPWEYGYGMNIYNINGELLYQFNKGNNVRIGSSMMENYALLKEEKSKFYFMAYSFYKDGLRADLAVVEFDMVNYKEKVLFSLHDSDLNVANLKLENLWGRTFTKKGKFWYVLADKRIDEKNESYIFEVKEDFSISRKIHLDNNHGLCKGFCGGKFAKTIMNTNKIKYIEM